MTHEDIKANTQSAGGLFKPPMVEIECEWFTYSSTGIGLHGLQVESCLLEKDEQIKSICADISDKMQELYKLIND